MVREEFFGGGLRVARIFKLDNFRAVVQIAYIRPQTAQGERGMGIAGVKR